MEEASVESETQRRITSDSTEQAIKIKTDVSVL